MSGVSYAWFEVQCPACGEVWEVLFACWRCPWDGADEMDCDKRDMRCRCGEEAETI